MGVIKPALKRYNYMLLALLYTVFANAVVQAQPEVLLTDATQLQALNSTGKYWNDVSASFSLPDVVRQQLAFAPMTGKLMTLRLSTSAHWFRFRVRSTSQKPWTLFVGTSGIDSATLYVVRPDGSYNTQISGEQTALAHRAIRSKYVYLPMELPLDTACTIYLRVRSRTGDVIENVVLSQQALYERRSGVYILAALILGVMVFAVLYNAVLLIVTGDKLYVWYVVFVALFAVLIVVTNFPVLEHFFPSSVGIGYYTRTLCVFLVAIASTLFTRSFLQTWLSFRGIDRLLIGSVGVYAVIILIFGLGVYDTAHRLFTATTLVTSALTVGFMGVIAFQRKHTAAIRLYALTLALYTALSVSVVLLRVRLAQPDSQSFGYYIMAGGIGLLGCVEVIAFSLVLAARIRELRESYYAEQAQRLQAEQNAEHERLRTLQAQFAAQQAELDALRYQINPHFLFNALSSLRALVTEDAHRARGMISKIAEYLQHAVYSGSSSNHRDTPHNGFVTVAEEVHMLRHYFDIEHIRFEDNVLVEYSIAAEGESIRIPSFLLQPLAENALKYGMKTSAMPLRIGVSVAVVESTEHRSVLAITVSNTGTILENQQQTSSYGGVGLQNVRERLRHAFGLDAELKLYEEKGWVIAAITIALPTQHG